MALAILAGSAGCSSFGGSASCSTFLAATARNFTEIPIETCDEKKLEWRNRHRAERAWAEVKRSFEGHCWTKDYARGFIEGYADYLTNGGNGEPPASPPFRYWLRPYQSPDGLRAIDEWFAGFRHGAAMAQASGARATIVIPLSAVPSYALPRYMDTDGQPEPPTAPPAVEPEELKPPKKLSRSR
jgi:hypothetical protein